MQKLALAMQIISYHIKVGNHNMRNCNSKGTHKGTQTFIKRILGNFYLSETPQKIRINSMIAICASIYWGPTVSNIILYFNTEITFFLWNRPKGDDKCCLIWKH